METFKNFKLKHLGDEMKMIILVVVSSFVFSGCSFVEKVTDFLSENNVTCEKQPEGGKVCNVMVDGQTFIVTYDEKGNETSRKEKK